MKFWISKFVLTFLKIIYWPLAFIDSGFQASGTTIWPLIDFIEFLNGIAEKVYFWGDPEDSENLAR